MAAKGTKAWGSVLRFIASLIFLYVIFAGVSQINGAGNPAALWVPLLFAGAVISSIALFFMSIAGIAMPSKEGAMFGSKISTFASLTLLALTVFASSTWTVNTWGWYVIVGFIIGWIGSAIDWHGKA
ncbi:MAG: hypothetical protein KGH60_03095 [Candidatus Micrarchaeota archaeon]|nr:hypothetical protein [Candidatus Micrarchaeota archaeon]